MEVLFVLAVIVCLSTPLIARLRNKAGINGTKKLLVGNIALFFGFVTLAAVFGLGTSAMAAGEEVVAATGDLAKGLGLIGASLSTLGSCIGAGIAVSGAASAALGAISEDPKLFGKALIFVALGESVALYGLLISILILGRI